MSKDNRVLLMKCIEIMKNVRSVKKAIIQISKLEYNEDEYIGFERACRVYYKYVRDAVPYKAKLYANNGDLYNELCAERQEEAERLFHEYVNKQEQKEKSRAQAKAKKEKEKQKAKLRAKAKSN